jgi:ribonuclease BN (tRNA processing enzyme)
MSHHPTAVHVQFLGSGDAFGSGGRLQTCFLLRGAQSTCLIDCGASALISMRRFGISPNEIGTIVLSHLHGDHFGGIPFFILDAQLVSNRDRELTIVGPVGTRARVEEAMEVLFPGSSAAEHRFQISFVELEPGYSKSLGELTVTGFPVNHPSGAPAFALRLMIDGSVVAYSGDTDWTDSLVDAARRADLFIAEAYTFEKPIRYHLDLKTLLSHRDELGAKRLVLTHLGEDMIGRLDQLDCEVAEDGEIIELRVPPT